VTPFKHHCRKTLVQTALFLDRTLTHKHKKTSETCFFTMKAWTVLWFYGVALIGDAAAEVLTSTACPSLRWATYPARLDLFYFYLVEFPQYNPPDLAGVERAIAVGLTKVLEGCNAYGEPLHAVQLNEDGHRYSAGGEPNIRLGDRVDLVWRGNVSLLRVSFLPAQSSTICSSATPGNDCRVVRGLTSILLDTSTDGVADLAYDVMVRILADLTALNQFLDTPLVEAEFVRRIGENLVLLNGDNDDEKKDSSEAPTGAVTKIAVVSAITAFLLTALIFWGLHRSYQKKEENESENMKMAYYHAKRRKFWSQLEDEEGQSHPGLMMTEPPPLQTVTWSVSDITSESASIKSVLQMDRIDEEEDGSHDSRTGDVEEAKEEVREAPELLPLARPSMEAPPFIAHWRDDMSELAYRGTSLPDRIWELAAMPKSYWDESDPEAPTPEHTPIHGAMPLQGGMFLCDDEEEDISFADNQLDFSTDSPLPIVTCSTEEEDSTAYTPDKSPAKDMPPVPVLLHQGGMPINDEYPVYIEQEDSEEVSLESEEDSQAEDVESISGATVSTVVADTPAEHFYTPKQTHEPVKVSLELIDTLKVLVPEAILDEECTDAPLEVADVSVSEAPLEDDSLQVWAWRTLLELYRPKPGLLLEEEHSRNETDGAVPVAA
jgi:hypothetical protein